MFYRIIALFALFFFTACGGGYSGDMSPQTGKYGRKAANQDMSAGKIARQGAEGSIVQPGETTAAEVPLKVVKVGLLLPLSGQASDVGMALQDAATLALMDKFGMMENERMRVKVVLVPRDTGGTPAGAVSAARHVLNSGAQMIVGPLFAQEVQAVAPVAREYGVNVLTFSNNPTVAGGNVYVFGFLVEQQVKRVVNYALNQNLTQIGLLAPQNAYGSAVQSTAASILGRSGLELASQQMYSPVSNAEGEIDKLGAADQGGAALSAILVPEGGQKLAMLSRTLKARGLNQRLLGTGLWDDPTVLRSGDLVGGWFASSPPERFSAFEYRFRDNFGYAPPRISALAYDAMAFASSLAMASAGANFSDDAITDPVGYNGPVNGIFRCMTDGVCERGLAVMEVTSTGARIIDPAPKAFE